MLSIPISSRGSRPEAAQAHEYMPEIKARVEDDLCVDGPARGQEVPGPSTRGQNKDTKGKGGL